MFGFLYCRSDVFVFWEKLEMLFWEDGCIGIINGGRLCGLCIGVI